MNTGVEAAVPMEHREKMRFRLAAVRVKRRYPGPAGEILSAEIQNWEDFGYRLGLNSKVVQLVAEILDDLPGGAS